MVDEKLARIESLIAKLTPLVERIEAESAANRRERKMVFMFLTPMLAWICKKLGISP